MTRRVSCAALADVLVREEEDSARNPGRLESSRHVCCLRAHRSDSDRGEPTLGVTGHRKLAVGALALTVVLTLTACGQLGQTHPRLQSIAATGAQPSPSAEPEPTPSP